MSVLNWENIEAAELSNDPYPHFIVDQAIDLDAINKISQAFPDIGFAGLVPLNHVPNEGGFAELITDLQSQKLKQIIGNKLGVDLESMPPLITVRSHARQRDGKIHVDTFDKKVTILLYLNEDWQHEAGRLRVLRDGNSLDNYKEEITPLIGKMFVFKVTDNCWHGHKPLQAKRRALMLNYMADQASYNKHLKKHNRSAAWKRLKRKIGLIKEPVEIG